MAAPLSNVQPLSLSSQQSLVRGLTFPELCKALLASISSLVATIGNTQIILSWTAAVVADYLIEYKLSNSDTWLTFADGVSATSSTTVTGLVNGSAYDFRVSANISGGTSSLVVSATPSAPPGQVTNLAATSGNMQIALTWTAPVVATPSVTDYLIEYLPAGGAYTPFAHAASATTSITVTGLTNGVLYTFRVSAINAGGTGTASATATATPNAAPTATNMSAAQTYTRNTTLSLTAIVITDSDAGQTITATLTPSDTAAVSSFTVVAAGGVTPTFNGTTKVWAASGSVSGVNACLAIVQYVPATNYATNFTIATSVSDGVASAVTGTKAMTYLIPAPTAPPTTGAVTAAPVINITARDPVATGVSVTNNQALTAIKSTVGAGFNFPSSSSGANNSVIQTNTLNGFPTIRANNAIYQNAFATDLVAAAITQNCTIFYLVKVDVGGGFAACSMPTQNRLAGFLFMDAYYFDKGPIGTVRLTLTPSPTSNAYGKWAVITWRGSTSSPFLQLYRNNILLGQNTSTTPGTFPTSGSTSQVQLLGPSPSGSILYNAAQLIIYPYAMTSGEMTTVYNYLVTEWGGGFLP